MKSKEKLHVAGSSTGYAILGTAPIEALFYGYAGGMGACSKKNKGSFGKGLRKQRQRYLDRLLKGKR